jgi:hypothetical protein
MGKAIRMGESIGLLERSKKRRWSSRLPSYLFSQLYITTLYLIYLTLTSSCTSL